MKPTWLKDPAVWRELPLDKQLEELRRFHCTGPCGQSSSVLANRAALYNALTDAINAYRKKDAMHVALRRVLPWLELQADEETNELWGMLTAALRGDNISHTEPGEGERFGSSVAP